jgi:hypothetical protein
MNLLAIETNTRQDHSTRASDSFVSRILADHRFCHALPSAYNSRFKLTTQTLDAIAYSRAPCSYHNVWRDGCLDLASLGSATQEASLSCFRTQS